jgi:hypothetical protein
MMEGASYFFTWDTQNVRVLHEKSVLNGGVGIHKMLECCMKRVLNGEVTRVSVYAHPCRSDF